MEGHTVAHRRRPAWLVIIALTTLVLVPAGGRAGTPTDVVVPVSSWSLWWEVDPTEQDTLIVVAVDALNSSAYRINPHATVRVEVELASGFTEQLTLAASGPAASLAPGQHAAIPVVEDYGQEIVDLTVIEVTAGGHVVSNPIGGLGLSATGPIVHVPDSEEMTINVEVRNNRSTQATISKLSAAFYDAEGILAIGVIEPEVTIPAFGAAQFDVVAVGPGTPTSVRLGLTAATWAGPLVSWNNWFHDVGTSSFESDIAWIAEAGITKGCASFRYCPAAGVTRAQMASFLVRAFTPTAVIATDYFTDDETSTHEADINWLAAASLTTGCGGGRYCPDAGVTRAQMASFLARALELAPTATDYFTDDEASSHESDINRLAAAGLTSGCGDGKYCPTAGVTRGQMAAFLRRALE
jgi:hypothetical protein